MTLGLGKDFLDRATKIEIIKEKINKLNFMKLRHFYSSKDTIQKMNR